MRSSESYLANTGVERMKLPLARAELEQPSFEQVGLKELISGASGVFAKRGGREPGVHRWAR